MTMLGHLKPYEGYCHGSFEPAPVQPTAQARREAYGLLCTWASDLERPGRWDQYQNYAQAFTQQIAFLMAREAGYSADGVGDGPLSHYVIRSIIDIANDIQWRGERGGVSNKPEVNKFWAAAASRVISLLWQSKIETSDH